MFGAVRPTCHNHSVSDILYSVERSRIYACCEHTPMKVQRKQTMWEEGW